MRETLTTSKPRVPNKQAGTRLVPDPQSGRRRGHAFGCTETPLFHVIGTRDPHPKSGPTMPSFPTTRAATSKQAALGAASGGVAASLGSSSCATPSPRRRLPAYFGALCRGSHGVRHRAHDARAHEIASRPRSGPIDASNRPVSGASASAPAGTADREHRPGKYSPWTPSPSSGRPDSSGTASSSEGRSFPPAGQRALGVSIRP